jgi:hypothetical protein
VTVAFDARLREVGAVAAACGEAGIGTDRVTFFFIPADAAASPL